MLMKRIFGNQVAITSVSAELADQCSFNGCEISVCPDVIMIMPWNRPRKGVIDVCGAALLIHDEEIWKRHVAIEDFRHHW